MSGFRQGRGFLPSAILALTLSALAALAHYEHHLADPSCDDGRTASSGPCATCSGLHGAALGEPEIQVAPSAAYAPAPGHPEDGRAPRPAFVVSHAPRAPPLG
jgi:hypothetical protein